MDLKQPALAYTAGGNLEAHAVVTWLESNGVQAYAVEDLSGASLFAFGTLSQFHKPQVFVEKSDMTRAGELLRRFEQQRNARRRAQAVGAAISSECEQCGVVSEFPASQDGTTQSCPNCYAFMDVGACDWPEDFDFGVPETDGSQLPDNADDALDAASRLDHGGDWDGAIDVYRRVGDLWPEHANYVDNCIASIERKRDAAS